MINDENDKPELDSDAPKDETPKTWKMPEPVFRTSEGTRYISDADGEKTLEPVAQPQTQTSAPPVKSSKMPFILGGAFLLFFLVTALLIGIWYVTNLEVPKVLTPPIEKATPTPEPTAAPTETPATTPTPTSTPDPGGATLD